jgi:hypothetical protein
MSMIIISIGVHGTFYAVLFVSVVEDFSTPL